MRTLTAKLAFAGIRQRRFQSALCVIVVAAAAGSLAISLAVGSVADRPFERTFRETNGAHVTVQSAPGGTSLGALARHPGVVATTGIRPLVYTAFDRDGKRYGLVVGGLGESLPSVGRPLLLRGDWPDAGQVVLEKSFADFHDLDPGATLETPEGPVTVSGVAIVLAGHAYPQAQPGIALAREDTLRRIAPDVSTWRETIGLRLSDPQHADRVAADARSLGPDVLATTWLEDRAMATDTEQVVTTILTLFTVMLLLAAGAVLATLIGGRVVAQTHELGTLKAIGFTPAHLARVLAVEQLALAGVGVVIGLIAARLVTPLFTRPTASLLNASETPPFDPVRAGIVAVVVLGLVAVFTLIPGLLAGRRTTAETLAAGRSGGARRSRLGSLVDRLGLPTAAGVGARGSFARRGRTLLTVLALALTVASVVATLGMEASLDVATDPGVAPPIAGLDTPRFDPVDDDAGEAELLRPIVYSLDAVLLFVGLVNLLATLLLTTRERVRDLGVMKAIGLTPGQVTGALVSEQLVVACLAGLLGVPIGLALFRLGVQASDGAGEFAYPSWWSLALLVPAVAALVALLTAPLARRAAQVRVADALRFD